MWIRPTLYYGADVQRNLLKKVLNVAKKEKIKHQISTYNGNSGTDTGASNLQEEFRHA